MSRKHSSNDDADSINSDDFTCAICQDIFTRPVKLSCDHIFCAGCVTSLSTRGEDRCPLCRCEFTSNAARDVERQMLRSYARCKHCDQKLTVIELRAHLKSCVRSQQSAPPAAAASVNGRAAPVTANRSTFSCPLCNTPNLDANELLTHCTQEHAADGKIRDVVCPVCVAMPWGDPNQKSADFLQHLKIRHKFEYDRYVDYDLDDDEMLQQAIRASQTTH